MVPLEGERFSMAVESALVTNAAARDESMDQPTTQRENVSSTTAQ